MDVARDPALVAPGIEAAHGCAVCETMAGPALTPTIAKFSVTGRLTLNVNFGVQQKLVRKAFSYDSEIPRVGLQKEWTGTVN
jgi:hypothetical protein